MKILSVDTSAKTATIALVENGEILVEHSIITGTHSTTLLPMIESSLDLLGLTVKDIGLFAASVGPGSFTGIRIGVSTVKGLAFAYNTPCVGVSSLEAMAENFSGIEGIIVPAIDARRDMIYTAIFNSCVDGTVERLTDDCQIPITELFEMLVEYKTKPIYFTGDAYSKLMAHENAPKNAAVTPAKLRSQSAFGISSAAYKKWCATEDKSNFSDTALVPVYLKKSQAERERDERIAAQINN